MTTGSASLEVEWQFDAPDLAEVEQWLRSQPAYAPVSLDDRGEKTQHDTYLDSGDWRAFHAGYSLRVRAKDDHNEVTLKALTRSRDAGPTRRAEYSEPGDIASIATGDGPVGGRLRLILRRASVRPLFTVTTQRHTWIVSSAAANLAEVALDRTTITSDGTSTTLQRVEVEEIGSGGVAAVQAFVDALETACSLTPAAISKFEAGLLAVGLHPAPPDLGSVTYAPDDRATDRAYAILRRRFGELLVHEGGAALGDDLEAVHQMRVATRRLRAALRVFSSVVPEAVAASREEFRWLASMLGPVRDLDVQLEHLETLRRGSPWEEANSLAALVTQFERQRADGRAALLEALNSDRYAHLIEAFRAALLAGPPADSADTPSREVGRGIISRHERRFRRDARLLRRRSAHSEYHALRIRGKRLRYSLELFIDLYGRDGASALTALRALQDLLGELQDLATTDERLRILVRTHAAEMPADTLVMVGRLIEQHRVRSAEIVDAFPDARAAVLDRFARLQRALKKRPVAPPVDETLETSDAAPDAAVDPDVRAPTVRRVPPRTPQARPEIEQLRGAARTFIRMLRNNRP